MNKVKRKSRGVVSFIQQPCANCGTLRSVRHVDGIPVSLVCRKCSGLLLGTANKGASRLSRRKNIGIDNKDNLPYVGEIRQGRFIIGCGRYLDRSFIYRSCVGCGGLSWVRYNGGRSIPSMCRLCSLRAVSTQPVVKIKLGTTSSRHWTGPAYVGSELGVCPICFKELGETTRPHHIVPRSQGGSDDLRNLVYLCGRCHNLVESYADKRIYYTPALALKIRLTLPVLNNESVESQDGWQKNDAVSMAAIN